MLILTNWISNTALYPPAYIYAGMAKGKKEKQAEALCEKLYKFNWGNEQNVLGDLREAWRQLCVISTINYDRKIKHEEIDRIFDEVQELAIKANNLLTETFKGHEDLNKWSKTYLKATNSQLKEAFYTYRQGVKGHAA